jgi:menaquinol-cytochrome c reductase cytochrome b/c subunit
MATESRPVSGVTIRERNVAERQGAPVLTASPRSRPVTPAAVEADTVQVWPHLVVIEFLGAMVFTIMLVILSTLANAPLEPLANADRTPNPSKAPWYFMSLQELLLHMNPALAGVIVPTLALGAIAAIPYIDRGTRGLGIWWYNERGPRIIAFTFIYTAVIESALVALDKYIPLKDNFTNLINTTPGKEGPLVFIPQSLGFLWGPAEAQGVVVEAVIGWILPLIFMTFFMVVMVILLKVMFPGLNTSELIIAFFTGFFATFVVLTFIGQFMRGPGMELYMPWAVPPTDYGAP